VKPFHIKRKPFKLSQNVYKCQANSNIIWHPLTVKMPHTTYFLLTQLDYFNWHFTNDIITVYCNNRSSKEHIAWMKKNKTEKIRQQYRTTVCTQDNICEKDKEGQIKLKGTFQCNSYFWRPYFAWHWRCSSNLVH
jgi:hypothetical protein